MLGVALVVVGAIFLLKNLGIISGTTWDVIWPLILVVAGTAMILKKR
nr:hypothetical protein [uncultured bacterium]